MSDSHFDPDEIVDSLKLSNQLCSQPMSITTRMPAEIAVYIAHPSAEYPTQTKLFKDTLLAINEINRKIAVDLHRTLDAEDADIWITFGTAYVETDKTNYQSYAANVTSVYKGGDKIQGNGTGDIASKPVHIQLGHALHMDTGCTCVIERDTIIHEFGHALGLQEHFDGFNDRIAISSKFWDVLATLYSNPPGTPLNQLNVQRAL